MDDKTKLGPNVKKLFVERWSQVTLEKAGHAGGEFGKVSAVAARMAENEGSNIKQDAREAFEWVKAAISLVRNAPDCKWTTDEEIAGEIIKKLETRRAKQAVR